MGSTINPFEIRDRFTNIVVASPSHSLALQLPCAAEINESSSALVARFERPTRVSASSSCCKTYFGPYVDNNKCSTWLESIDHLLRSLNNNSARERHGQRRKWQRGSGRIMEHSCLQ